jgi:hypothetical protein
VPGSLYKNPATCVIANTNTRSKKTLERCHPLLALDAASGRTPSLGAETQARAVSFSWGVFDYEAITGGCECAH